jgi:quercetin dioxygenase-like cupin family protein
MDNATQSQVFQSGKEIQWEDASPGIKRQMFGYDDRIMLVKVKFEKGAVGAVHQHHHSQVSYVESGEFELTIGDEKKILKTGDGFFVPSNSLHGSVCLEPGVLIDVFSPQREDFLVSK